MLWDPTNLNLILSGSWSRTASVFKNGIKPKKTIKKCIFGLLSWHFRWKSEWNSNCTILRFHVIKRNVLPRKLSYENLQSWHSLPTLQSTNCFLHQCTEYLTGESFSTCLGFLAARFISIYKIERYLVNISKY